MIHFPLNLSNQLGLTSLNTLSDNNNNLIPLFTLSSIYNTYTSGAEEMTETNNIIQIKHNRVENPNWPEANQLAI